MVETVSKFNSYLRDFRGLTPATVEQYTKVARWYEAYCKVNEASRETRGAVLGFIDSRVSSTTYKRWAINILKSYFVFLGIAWPLSRKEVPKPSPPKQPRLTMEEAAMMLKKLRHPRDRAILRVLMVTGMRSGELCGLKRSDFKPPHLYLELEKTGGKAVRLLDKETVSTVQQYLKVRKDKIPYLFLSSTGIKLYPQLLGYMFKKYCRIGGVEEKSPHSSRRGVASMLYDEGLGLKEIQDFVGWKRIETAARYIKLRPEAVAKRGLEVNPLVRE